MQAGVDAKGSMQDGAGAPAAIANGHTAPLAAAVSHPAGTPAPAAAGDAPAGLAAGPGRPPLAQAHSQYSASPPAKTEEASKAAVVDVLDRASMAGQARPLEDRSVPAPELGAPAVRRTVVLCSSLLLWGGHKRCCLAPKAALSCAACCLFLPPACTEGPSHKHLCSVSQAPQVLRCSSCPSSLPATCSISISQAVMLGVAGRCMGKLYAACQTAFLD